MSILDEDEPIGKERDADEAMRALFNGTTILNELRQNNEGRAFVVPLADEIETVRDQLSRIFEDVRRMS